ncbi:MAG: hypothetical protein K0Q87_4126 [Neobacillus sp.]|nr:hypothetical protein [Neobacillus sp.]
MIEITKGLSGLIRNDGKIRLIASPKLSDEDIEAITYGYKTKGEVISGIFYILSKEILMFLKKSA